MATNEIIIEIEQPEIIIEMEGSAGDTGPAGKSIFQEAFDPTDEGIDGDSRLNNDTRDVFHKVDGDWEFAGNIKGTDGREIELNKSATYIQRRYVGDETWIDLVSLASLRGEDGTDGQEVEMRINATHIQRKLTNATSWIDLIAIADITGADGREVQLQNDGTHIQWKYDTDTERTNLIALADIRGEDGTDGKEIELQKSATHIQRRYVGDVAWINLVALTEITGQDGTDGTDGREVMLQKSATHIQWKYDTDVLWTDLVLLSDLKGDKGDKGDIGPGTLGINLDGQGNIILPGHKGGYKVIPYSGVITGRVLYEGSDTPIASNCVIDVWKKSSFYPTVTDTIFGTKPNLTAQTNNSATGLSIAVTAGDVIAYNVDSNDTAKVLNFSLLITKT